jgi:hypothetical protein
MMRLDGVNLVGVGQRIEEGDEADEVAELRGAGGSGDDEEEVIGPVSEEWVDAAAALDVDLTDSREEDISNALALVRERGGREARGIGQPRERLDMVTMVMDEGKEVQVSKTAAVAKLAQRFHMGGLVKSSDRLRRVCGMSKSVTGSGSGGHQSVLEDDVEQVQPFSPVVVLVQTDNRTEKNRKFVTMGIGVGIITTITNKSVGSGPLLCIPESSFPTGETKVDVHLVALSGADDGFVILHTNEIITNKPLPFMGNQFISLVKPQLVVDEETGTTFYRL